jgi:hypothetical protein
MIFAIESRYTEGKPHPSAYENNGKFSFLENDDWLIELDSLDELLKVSDFSDSDMVIKRISVWSEKEEDYITTELFRISFYDGYYE